MNENDTNAMNWYAPLQQKEPAAPRANWYAPLEIPAAEAAPEQPAAPAPSPYRAKKPKSKRKAWFIAAACILGLALIVGTSVAAAKHATATGVTIFGGSGDETLPKDRQEFFENYYTKTDGIKQAKIDIPRVQLPVLFEMQLAEPHTETIELPDLYESCSRYIVGIKGYVGESNDRYFWGTGIVVSSDGLIVTNTHVLDTCCRAEVTLYDNTVCEAKLVGADATSDIAVLKIDRKGLEYAEFGDSTRLSVGDPVAAIGNPLGEEFRLTLTDGIISAIERGVNTNGITMNLLQTNTALNEGNSGGALFNRYGQVIGVTNMKMMSAVSSIEGIGFAIPSSTVKEVVNLLVKDGKIIGRASIGITVGTIPQEAKDAYSLPDGLYISEVQEDSDACAKGVRPGDVLVEVNGKPVTSTQDVADVKDKLGVGDSMTMTIYRDGKTFTVDVVLKDTNDVYG